MNTETAPTPYDLLGGETAVRALVDRFYDLMDSDPQAAALRAMHASDLGPMRDKLTDWLGEWLGGPPRYRARPDAVCLGSAHHPYAIDAAMRDQWLACMYLALEDCGAPEPAQALLRKPLASLAEFLRNR